MKWNDIKKKEMGWNAMENHEMEMNNGKNMVFKQKRMTFKNKLFASFDDLTFKKLFARWFSNKKKKVAQKRKLLK